MTNLTLDPNLENADDIYALLLSAHDGVSPEQSTALNARLILILANHIGDADVIRQALHVAQTP